MGRHTPVSTAEKRRLLEAAGEEWPTYEDGTDKLWRVHSGCRDGGYFYSEVAAQKHRERNRVENMTPDQLERKRKGNRVENLAPDQLERKRKRSRERKHSAGPCGMKDCKMPRKQYASGLYDTCCSLHKTMQETRRAAREHLENSRTRTEALYA